jgi:peptide/nickel transport system permease protein
VSGYLARRAGQAIVVVIGVMIVTFILIHLEPGSVARSILGIRATSDRIAIFNAAYGLDQPLYRQLISYVEQVAHGNLGTSYYLQQPVSGLFAQRLPRDLLLLGASTVLALLISLPMGIYQAVRRGGLTDNVLGAASFTLYCMPAFWIAVMLVALLAVQSHVFLPEAPAGTSVGSMLAQPRALALPVLTLTLVQVSGFSRYMRSAAIDVLAQDFLRVVRAKGLPERLILSRHVLRNALLPVVTIVGLSLPGLVTGAIVVEEVFNYQGMGLLFFDAATHHDFPVLLGSTLIVGVATVVGSLLADIGYALLDPRIRYASR